MAVNQDGFCLSCHQWALEFPALECPWCHSVSADAARERLNIDPDTDPVTVLIAVREELETIRKRQREVFALRSIAARALLRRGNIAEDVKAAHTRLWAVERWAIADQPQEVQKRLAPRQMKTKKGMRVEYEERLARREEIFKLTQDDNIPTRLRPTLGRP